MDYKEKYEMALEGIQEILGSGEDSIKMSRLQLRLQGIFPELKENKDEDILKGLISMCKTLGKTKWIAWLEKQGEQKPIDLVAILKDYFTNTPKEQQDKDWEKLKHLNNFGWELVEQKHDDKVEPKFKVGDIIKHKKHGFTCKIIAVDTEYKLSDGLYLPFDFQDAYELVEQNPIECSEDNLPEFESYLCLMFQKFRTKGICTNGEIIDYVMEHSQKLKDTLCHAWSEEDELNLSEALHHIRMYNLADKADKLDKWLKSLKTRVQPQQQWNEENERLFQIVIDILDRQNHLGNISRTDLIACVRKLKSLRPQSTWRPSDKQIYSLDRALRFYGKGTAVYDSVKELLEQLKKLKG